MFIARWQKENIMKTTCTKCGTNLPMEQNGSIFDWRTGRLSTEAAPIPCTCETCFRDAVDDLTHKIVQAKPHELNGVFIRGMSEFGASAAKTAISDVFEE
jgi:hypothetical protein